MQVYGSYISFGEDCMPLYLWSYIVRNFRMGSFAGYRQDHLTNSSRPYVRVSVPGATGKMDRLKVFWRRVHSVCRNQPIADWDGLAHPIDEESHKATCWAIEKWIFCHFGYQVGALFTPYMGIRSGGLRNSGFVLDEKNTRFNVVEIHMNGCIKRNTSALKKTSRCIK